MSYPETSSFLECRAVQVSPLAPAAFLRPRQPSSAGRVALLPYAPRARLSLAFTSCQVRIPSRGRPCPRRPSTLAKIAKGMSGSNGALQLRAPLAAWRTGLAVPRYGGNWIRAGGANLVGLADRRALAGVCVRQLGGLRDGVSRVFGDCIAQLAEPARGAPFCAPAAVSCVSYINRGREIVEHQEVSA